MSGFSADKMSKKQVIDFLTKCGIWVKDGHIAKADVERAKLALENMKSEDANVLHGQNPIEVEKFEEPQDAPLKAEGAVSKYQVKASSQAIEACGEAQDACNSLIEAIQKLKGLTELSYKVKVESQSLRTLADALDNMHESIMEDIQEEDVSNF